MKPVNLKISHLHPGSNYASVGLPLPKGSIEHCEKIAIYDHTDTVVNSVIKPTSHWSDGSVKWCLVKVSLVNQNSHSTNLTLRLRESESKAQSTTPMVRTVEDEGSISIESGSAKFNFKKGASTVFPTVTMSGKTLWNTETNNPVLTNENGHESTFCISDTRIEDHDALTSICIVSGYYEIEDNKKLLADFKFEILPDAKLNLVCVLQNPQRAMHPGGIWDLGDPGSIKFKDFSIALGKVADQSARLKVESGSEWITESEPMTLFQASSGGENWDSPVHVNANGDNNNQFKGYRITRNTSTTAEGARSEPVLAMATTDNTNYTASIKNFWQNFPKSIDIQKSTVSLGLFPHQHQDLHELQGGERKTHEIFFDFTPTDISSLQSARPHAGFDASVYKQAEVFRYFDHELKDQAYDALIEPSMDPSKGYMAKREMQDEFGWRNYGEVFADHETAYHTGDELFISHYNNQYDSIGGFAKQYALTSNPAWFQLMSELAEHVMDIDIYHTDQDRAEYNNGLFWHTDHYLEAKTATHRTYSARQIDEHGNPPAGGGPGSQHCYSSGLVYYHYMTGSLDAKNTVLNLGEWIHNYYEGTGTLLETAKKTLQSDSKNFINTCKGSKVFKYTYPMDRGTGNYIRTLLDCFDLTKEKRYLEQIEHIITNTAGPSDEIDARGFDDIEYTWFYVIFLQEVVRYLDLKRELDQFDNNFYYARSTLLHYARWMTDNAEPYLSNPDALDHPNSTWAAQEPRRVHILYAAYRYALKNRTPFIEKARYLRDQLINELSQADDTLHYARVQALLLQNHGPSAFLDVDSLPYPGFRETTVPDDQDCFHTPGSHLKNIAGNWASSISKFRIGKEIRWIKARSS